MTKQYINDNAFDDDVFERRYIIKPFTEDEVDDEMELHSVEDKLRYFLTLYYQSWIDDPDSDKVKFMELLKKVFPNTIFSLELKHSYVLEDGEYFFDSYFEQAKCTNLMDEYTLKKFMIYGTINFGDRDREEYRDKINHIRYHKDLWNVDWSG
jgi:hypothetical protein